jgi:hypothetical protein
MTKERIIEKRVISKKKKKKKQAERWLKRLLAAEIKREEKKRREELGLNSESSEPSFSSSNSPVPEHSSATQYEEPYPFISRTPSSILYNSDCHSPSDVITWSK